MSASRQGERMKYVIVTLTVILAGLLGVIAASCGTGSGAQSAGPAPTAGPVQSGSHTETGGSETVPPDTETSGGGGPALLHYQVWFHRGEQLFVVTRTQEATPRVGTAALGALLEGPTESERTAGVQT